MKEAAARELARLSVATRRKNRPEKIRYVELSKEDERTLQLYEPDRPKKRSDCLSGGINEQRPCPWASCRYHLSVEVIHDRRGASSRAGVVKLRIVPDWEERSSPTCALDVAEVVAEEQRESPTTTIADEVESEESDDCEQEDVAQLDELAPRRRKNRRLKPRVTLDEIGKYLDVTRERIRQLEAQALVSFRRAARNARLLEGFESISAEIHAMKADDKAAGFKQRRSRLTCEQAMERLRKRGFQFDPEVFRAIWEVA